VNNEQIIFNAAVDKGVPKEIAVMIVEQAKVESANFTSHVFQTDNNAFGMKMPKVRKTTYIAGPSTIVMTAEGSTPYAHYNSLEDSAKDLVSWLEFQGIDFSKIKNDEDYTAFLNSKGYYGISQDSYLAAMRRYYDDAMHSIGVAYQRNSGAIIATGVTLVLMATYFIIRIAKAKK
jgi:uncharacterized FlgJ-related protein